MSMTVVSGHSVQNLVEGDGLVSVRQVADEVAAAVPPVLDSVDDSVLSVSSRHHALIPGICQQKALPHPV
jgi:hypothetical protein